MKFVPPDWPAMMRLATAAAYLDLSPAAFKREIAIGRMPTPIKFGGRDSWRRDAIDACIDALSGSSKSAIPEWQREFEAKYGKIG
jgi:predicted DNA-binding transcriptional regulator AlpA